MSSNDVERRKTTRHRAEAIDASNEGYSLPPSHSDFTAPSRSSNTVSPPPRTATPRYQCASSKSDRRREGCLRVMVRDAIEATVDQIIKVADRDGDKKLSKVELRAASQKHPEILEKLKNLA